MHNKRFKIFIMFNLEFCFFVFQESLDERVKELEKILENERAAAQRDRATITKLQLKVVNFY